MSETLAADIAAIARIEAVQKILEVVCRTTGMGFSAVARVTEHRWIACAVRDEIAFGLEPGGELRVETTLCDEVRRDHAEIVIDHVAEDETYCDHPTAAMYGLQSYISVPIVRADGRFFGTLCAIDPRPARLKNPATIGMFRLFAELIAIHLDAEERLQSGELALRDERQTAELREQFIAILGHDLRNPLAAIDAGASLMMHMPLEEKAVRVLGRIQRSVVRMSDLITDVMDFARGRLGGGLSLSRSDAVALDATLDHVVAELQSAWPGRVIATDVVLRHAVVCDSARIGQLFSNLLSNALVHGTQAAPVRVRARSDNGEFELSVTNRGEPMSHETIGRLFQPFSRGAGQSGQQGLGLGLYIASEIARAHDGTVEVASSDGETHFTLRMPVAAKSIA